MMEKVKHKCNVDKGLFSEVEDLHYFNNIDWGTRIWDRTINGLQIALNDKVEICKSKMVHNLKYVLKYNLTGFPPAFQVIFLYDIYVTLTFESITYIFSFDRLIILLFFYICVHICGHTKLYQHSQERLQGRLVIQLCLVCLDGRLFLMSR